jgi:hypothetical protein
VVASSRTQHTAAQASSHNTRDSAPDTTSALRVLCMLLQVPTQTRCTLAAAVCVTSAGVSSCCATLCSVLPDRCVLLLLCHALPAQAWGYAPADGSYSVMTPEELATARRESKVRARAFGSVPCHVACDTRGRDAAHAARGPAHARTTPDDRGTSCCCCTTRLAWLLRARRWRQHRATRKRRLSWRTWRPRVSCGTMPCGTVATHASSRCVVCAWQGDCSRLRALLLRAGTHLQVS